MRAYQFAIATVSLIAFVSPAIHAQDVPGSAQAPTKVMKKADPNEIVCEKQKVPGSRLAVAKVCKTRAEWADLRLQDRLDLERVQTQRGMTPQ